VVEIVKDAGEDDGAIRLPSGPGVRACKAVEDLLGFE